MFASKFLNKYFSIIAVIIIEIDVRLTPYALFYVLTKYHFANFKFYQITLNVCLYFDMQN